MKGDHIGFTTGTSTFDFMHFDISFGGREPSHYCNPWKYLPNSDNDYTSFDATVTLQPNYHGINCEAVVNVSVPPDQLTFNRIELHIIDSNDSPQEVQFYDMCGAVFNHSREQLDNWEYNDDPDASSSYTIRISPGPVTSRSYERNEPATYGFEFIDLPVLTGAKVMAKVFDIFDNSQETAYMVYTCTDSETPPTVNTPSATNDSTTSPTNDSTTTPTNDSTTTPTNDSTTSATDDSTTSPTNDSTTSATDDSTTSPTNDSTTSATDSGNGALTKTSFIHAALLASILCLHFM